MDPPGQYEGRSNMDSAERDMESLQKENERLRQDLDDCRGQLFQILQRTKGVPESDIKNAFHAIYSGIDAWIDEAFAEESLESAFHNQFRRAKSEKERFRSLGLHPQCYADIKWISDFGRLEYCFHIVLCRVISKFLTDITFRGKETKEWEHLYPHSLTKEEIVKLVDLQRAMKNDLHRDESEISRWRGQAIAALLTFPHHRIRAEEVSRVHLQRLKEDLEAWLGKIPGSLTESLKTNVLQRATKALDMICCSNKTYSVGSLDIPPGPNDGQNMPGQFRDMITWRQTPSSAIVDLLQCLWPVVMRIGESGQDDLLLVQPTWLGYTEPGRLPRPLTPTPKSSSPDEHGNRRPDRERAVSRSSRSQGNMGQLQQDPSIERSKKSIQSLENSSSSNPDAKKVSIMKYFSASPTTSLRTREDHRPNAHVAPGGNEDHPSTLVSSISKR
ncbi:hypothetical protein M406DRAFT_353489 [Cryphonectria parasitica EP155]|uniref:Uncharacterized protein n=1 Tax=Cryphonectria parasitica (strain ATCC 38755 / EP155) TaxID=660469 RepID=A0A9P4XTU6_CRYP1|nr:uncharacterized protein M406DRAFT_353489 [Cryphonectria parasitica EP155]KAF3760675.1 hypothetical protein M406DRAFT_353489 [Cryphonectria parasitica EP155]